jgi:hypothetical protein
LAETQNLETPSLPRITVNRFLFFLIWPFASLVAAFGHFRKPFTKTIFWLFCVYFGFVFIYADPFGIGGADSARYAKQLIESHQHPLSLNNLILSFYNPVDGLTDIYQPFITWLVSLFSGDPRIMFMVFAMVFGYFWVQNIWIVISSLKRKPGYFALLLIASFILVNPIWNINGVRMWTAAQVFLYGTLLYLLEGRKSGLIWIASSLLFHFSFMFPVTLMLVFLFLPHRLWMYFIFFITASFIREINVETVRETLSFLPDVFQPKIESYTNEPYIRKVLEAKQEYAWHVQFSGLAERIVIYTIVFMIYFRKSKWINGNPFLIKLFMLALFIGGFAQLANLIPSGGRFISIAYSLFYTSAIILTVNLGQEAILNILKLIITPLILFVIVFKIRVGFDYLGILVFLGNPFMALFINDQTPIINFIKEVF